MAGSKVTFHSAIFKNLVCPVHEDQMMPTEKYVMPSDAPEFQNSLSKKQPYGSVIPFEIIRLLNFKELVTFVLALIGSWFQLFPTLSYFQTRMHECSLETVRLCQAL